MRTLGYLIWWNLGGARVPHAELRAALDAAGFPLPLTPPTALVVEQRALRAWEAQRLASSQSTEAELAALRAAYQDVHVSGDITRLLGQLVELVPGAVGVRQDGGLIFAPPAALPDLLRLRRLIGSLPATEGVSPALYLVGLTNEPETRAALAGAVTMGLLQDIAALEHDLLRLQVGGRAPRSRTLAVRQAQVRVIRERAQYHAGLLDTAQQATVQQALDRLEQRLTELERER